MNLAFIGGTQFVGRYMVEAALVHGHRVTVFHRGQTNPGLFPDVEHVQGDRSVDLARLAGRRFDALIDVCAYLPREVEQAVVELGANIGRYLYVSSVSAYRPSPLGTLAEDSPLLGAVDLDDPSSEVINDDTYGPFEALCEDAALAGFGDRTIILRPTFVVGPHDPSDRFTYWVRRIATGGPVIAAGPADAPIQLIDGRDLGAFAVTLIEAGAHGAFNGVGPAGPITWAGLLDATVTEVGRPDTRIVWADPDQLHANNVDLDVPAGFPMWAPAELSEMLRASPAKALAAGLHLRPLDETITDIRRWDQARGLPPLETGLSDRVHDELLTRLDHLDTD
jgi:2'-hydroxyisoflavone reductase